MSDIVEQLIQSHRAGRSVVLTSLVETRGSTPQKAGARMLIHADGTQSGTLGGGCVEAEVKRTALEILHSGAGDKLLTLTLDHDYGWDDGLICGGRMTALLAVVTPRTEMAYYVKLDELTRSGLGFTEATCLNDPGPGIIPKVLFDSTGRIAAVMGDRGEIESVAAAVRPLAERPRPYVEKHWSFLPSLPRCRVLIIGAGHVGQKVAEYARDVDFDVWVMDDRAEFCNVQRIPWAQRHLVGKFDEVLPELTVEPNTFVVIVTRGHNHDEEALFHLIGKRPRYLGMIGSRRKIRLIFDDLRQAGVDEVLLQGVQAPIGLDIGSKTVPEIAIAIVAQLIAVRARPFSK